MTTPISVSLIDILECAAEDARGLEHHPQVLALIIAARAVVRASRGEDVQEDLAARADRRAHLQRPGRGGGA